MIAYMIIVLVCCTCGGFTLNDTNVTTQLPFLEEGSPDLNRVQNITDGNERANISYPTTGVNGMVGFAKVAGVSGGTGGPVVFVSTIDEFGKAVAGSDKKIVVINRNLTASNLTKVFFGSNKSIIGSYGNNILHNVHLRDTQSSVNVIFQNIVFRHDEQIKGNDDIQLYLNHGSGYWIDHCYWPGHNWNATDGSTDKLIYIGDKANYVTISHCYFANHKYGCIFGYPADNENQQFFGYPRMTICHNRYENIEVRAPGLMRYGYYHVYNNYVNNFHLSFTFLSHANIVSESNFLGAGSENARHLDDKGNAKFTDHDSIPKMVSRLSSPAEWVPSNNYSYILMTAANAKNWNIAHSGVAASEDQLYFANNIFNECHN